MELEDREEDPDAPGAVNAKAPSNDFGVTGLEAALIIPLAIWLAWQASMVDWATIGWGAFFFVVCIAAVDLIPIPAWEEIEVSLSFPIMIGVAMLYSPPVAGMIAIVGSSDMHELRHQIPFLRSMWNRSQMALAIVAASMVFRQLAEIHDAWWLLLPATLAVTIVAYAINAILVALHASLEHGLTVRQVLRKMHGRRPVEFLLSYIGLALFGVVIARFFIEEGAWSVVVFLAPLVFARQMYFQSHVMADRLAEQNEVLTVQAERLEHLLKKESATVDQLRELNRMKGEFVAVVSHELRTPITAMIGFVKTLRQPQFADDPILREEFLERMERQGNRLVGLVENLLTTSRLESDQLSISIGRVSFEDLCRETVEGLGTDAERIVTSVPDDIPVLHTDRQLLGRVLTNLLDNAIKYSPEDEPCELGARADGDDLVFWVRDRGIGIDREEVGRIFDRFYQVDSSSTRRFRGAGLGLSMVRDLVRHLGGTVTVESAPGEGSTFNVCLPMQAPASKAASPG